jgi:hypothetical protein
MSILVQVGVLSVLLTVGFTFWAALQKSSLGGQTVRASIAEAWTNIAIGFAINYVANLLVLPLAGLPVSASGAFWIGCIFTAISVMRSFLLRRWFNWQMVRNNARLTR